MEDKDIKQLIREIHAQLKPISELSASVVIRAELQSYTEDLYNQLVQLAYDNIAFLAQLELDQVVDASLLASRDKLVVRAQHLVLDSPNTTQT